MVQRIVSHFVMISILSLAGTDASFGCATCKVFYDIRNLDRMVVNSNLSQECGGFSDCHHTAPFGNWGVDSEFSMRGNDNQFDGWMKEGNQYQWNTCTSNQTDFPVGDQKWYNFPDGEYSAQLTETGSNVISDVRMLSFPVSCPDEGHTSGGCMDISGFPLTQSVTMDIFELDPFVPLPCPNGDDFVTSLSFTGSSKLQTTLQCTAGGCTGVNWILVGSDDIVARAAIANVTAGLDTEHCEEPPPDGRTE